MSYLIKKLDLKISQESILAVLAVVFVSILIFYNFYFPFNFLVYFFCLLIAGVFIFKFPEVGLYVLIFTTFVFERAFALQPIVLENYTALKLYPLDIIIIFTALALFFKLLISHTKIILWEKKLDTVLWLFFALVSVVFLVSLFIKDVDPVLAFSTFKNYGLYFIVYILVINIIRSKEQFNRLIKTFIAGGLGLLYFIFYGFITGQGKWTEIVPLSTWGNRLLGGFHSFYVLIALILILNIIFWKKKWLKTDYFYLALIFIFIAGIVGSLQRHIWVALILSLGVCFYFYSASQWKKIFQIIMISLMVALFISLVFLWLYSIGGQSFFNQSDLLLAAKIRLASFFNSPSSDSSAIWRITVWQEAWRQFSSHWLLGIGFGQRINFSIDSLDYVTEVRNLHNDFVGVAVQMGLVGILFFIYLIYQIIRDFLKNFRKTVASYQGYSLAFFALIIAFLWSANFGTYFDINLLVIFFWIFLGGLRVSQRLGSKA